MEITDKEYKDLKDEVKKYKDQAKSHLEDMKKVENAFEEFKLNVPEPVKITKIKVNDNFEFVDLGEVVKYELKGNETILLLKNSRIVNVGAKYKDKVLKILESLGWEV